MNSSCAKNIFSRIIAVIGFLMLCACDVVNTSNQTSKEMLSEIINDTWQAKMFGFIYDVASNMAGSAFLQTSEASITLLSFGFAFWLAIKIGSALFAFKPKDPAEFWSEVGSRSALIAICAILLASTENVLFVVNTIIMPVFSFFISLAGAILQTSSSLPTENYLNNILDWEVASGQGLPDGPKEAIMNLIKDMHQKLSYGYVAASSLFFESGLLDLPKKFSGVLLYIFSFLLDTVFAFYLLDLIIRFAIMIALLPIIILSYAFPKTREMAKESFNIILNSGLTITTMTIGVTIAAAVNEGYVKNTLSEYNDDDAFIVVTKCLVTIILCLSSIKYANKLANQYVGTSFMQGIVGNAFGKATNLLWLFVSLLLPGGALAGIGTKAAQGAKTAVKAASRAAKIASRIAKTAKAGANHVTTAGDKGDNN